MAARKAISLEQVLFQFRATETTEDAMVIVADDQALQVLAAWKNSTHRWVPPVGKPPVYALPNGAALWDWICHGWTIDTEEVAHGAGLSDFITRDKLRVLQRNRLIYPDGSIAKGAHLALQAGMARRLGVKPKTKKTKVEDGNAN